MTINFSLRVSEIQPLSDSEMKLMSDSYLKEHKRTLTQKQKEKLMSLLGDSTEYFQTVT